MKVHMSASIVIVGILLLLFVSACERGHASPTPAAGGLATPSSSDLAVLHATVIDEATGKPVAGAIVYIGYRSPESWRCHTDEKGECVLQSDAIGWGDYGVSAFKKGYEHVSESVHLKPGDNYITIELPKKSQPLESATVSGVLIEVVAAEGTRSENHYVKIREDDGQTEFVFNEVGENEGFDEFIGKRVQIQGFRDVGRVGWQAQEVEGIYVERITVVESE